MKTLSQRLVEQADAYVWSELTVKSLLREAAALARRVEEAPVVLMTFGEYAGKRVRIVEE